MKNPLKKNFEGNHESKVPQENSPKKRRSSRRKKIIRFVQHRLESSFRHSSRPGNSRESIYYQEVFSGDFRYRGNFLHDQIFIYAFPSKSGGRGSENSSSSVYPPILYYNAFDLQPAARPTSSTCTLGRVAKAGLHKITGISLGVCAPRREGEKTATRVRLMAVLDERNFVKHVLLPQ